MRKFHSQKDYLRAKRHATKHEVKQTVKQTTNVSVSVIRKDSKKLENITTAVNTISSQSCTDRNEEEMVWHEV